MKEVQKMFNEQAYWPNKDGQNFKICLRHRKEELENEIKEINNVLEDLGTLTPRTDAVLVQLYHMAERHSRKSNY